MTRETLRTAFDKNLNAVTTAVGFQTAEERRKLSEGLHSVLVGEQDYRNNAITVNTDNDVKMGGMSTSLVINNRAICTDTRIETCFLVTKENGSIILVRQDGSSLGIVFNRETSSIELRGRWTDLEITGNLVDDTDKTKEDI